MSNNTTLNLGSGGDVVRTLDRQSNGTKTQVVQLDVGGASTNAEALLTGGQQTMANSLPVVIASNQSGVATLTQDATGTGITSLADGAGAVGLMSSMCATNYVVSTANSTTTQLAASATFNGTIETVFNQQAVSILLTCDQNCTLTVNQYIDSGGTRVSSTWTFSVTAGSPFSRCLVANGNYIKFSLQNNGGSTTTTLNLNVAYGTLPNSTQLGNNSTAINEIGGTQVSTPYLPVFKTNTSRTFVHLWAVAAAAGTTGTETAITLTRSGAAGASTTTGTSFTPTSGKRFRITSMSFATRGNATATVQTTTFALRVNTAGAVTTTSNIWFSARSATPATASAWDRYALNFGDDGPELVGDGTLQYGVTAAATYTTNAPTWDVEITGYEF